MLLCAEFSVILHLEKIFNFQANNIHIHNIIRKDMKPALILRTYTWLYYTIREFGPLTFNEINKMWKEEERLSEGNSMVRQTFARHRSDLEEILGVRISCDKRHRYYIKNDSLSYQNDRTILLNAAINQMLIKDSEIQKRIILDPKLEENAKFDKILYCMLRNVMVDIGYQQDQETVKHYQKVEPYYFMQCHENWFMVGRMKCGRFFPFALDKIIELRRTKIRFRLEHGFSVKSCEDLKDFSVL